MALTFSTLTKPPNSQVVDPSTGEMREEWQLYFDGLTKRLNGAVGALSTDPAPADADYVVATAHAGLSAERVVTNSTSITRNVATPGQIALERAALTGDVAASANSNATAIQADVVLNTMLANMAESTIKGRAAGAGTGDPTDLTAAQVLTILGSFSSLNVQSFTASGTYTPTSGMKYCLVISTGGGGGGGNADSDGSSQASGGGGGGGATCIESFSAATIGASQTVTIGAAGTAGSGEGAVNGGNGGNTTFGALHTAGGGVGGSGIAGTATAIQANGGAGGTATGGLVNIPGGTGGQGTALILSGYGGGSLWGGPGAPGVGVTSSTSVAGNTATVFGTGGSGGGNANQPTAVAGGAGFAGICVVIEFI